MIVGAGLDGSGRPSCCALGPGNTADVTTLIPVVGGRGDEHRSIVCLNADEASKEAADREAIWRRCASNSVVRQRLPWLPDR